MENRGRICHRQTVMHICTHESKHRLWDHSIDQSLPFQNLCISNPHTPHHAQLQQSNQIKATSPWTLTAVSRAVHSSYAGNSVGWLSCYVYLCVLIYQYTEVNIASSLYHAYWPKNCYYPCCIATQIGVSMQSIPQWDGVTHLSGRCMLMADCDDHTQLLAGSPGI